MVRALPAALAALLVILPSAAAARGVSRCPRESRPVRTVDPLHPWACVLADERYRDGIECPTGTHSITTSDQYDPFKCALTGLVLLPPRGICPPGHQPIPTADPDKEYDCEKVGKGFKGGPRCPRGTRPLPTPGALRPFRCVPGSSARESEPSATPNFRKRKKRSRGKKGTRKKGKSVPKDGKCPKGMRKLYTENPFEPVQCVRKAPKRPKRLRYKKYRVGGELSFQYPDGWDLEDAWRDEEPAIYLLLDTKRDGRPVSLSIAKHLRGSEDFLSLESRIWQEKDWHGARETGRKKVASRPTVHMSVSGHSEMAFVDIYNGYLVVSFTAPEDLYDSYLPAYRRMLDSLRLHKREAPRPSR